MPLDLDWHTIRPLNGTKHEAFEELCCQLARSQAPPDARFYRKGRPDAGLEAVACLPDGSEWGWQSKYFHSLGPSQWSQLDESVRAALDKHPALARFIVCVPLDLADARLKGRRSARERWEEKVAEWTRWASAEQRRVDFVWQGGHQLFGALAQTRHQGLTAFFFGARFLDERWMQRRLAEAHQAAGARYTPTLNIQLPLSRQFEALGRTRPFFDRIRAMAIPLRERLHHGAYRIPVTSDPALNDLAQVGHSACQHALVQFAALSDDPTAGRPLELLRDSLRAAVHATDTLYTALLPPRRATNALEATPFGRSTTRSGGDDPTSHGLRTVRSLLADALTVVQEAAPTVDARLLMLTGQAGSGKTHLLCDLAQRRLDAGLPTVVLMGQRFLDTSEPWTQALQQLDLSGWTAEECVDALEVVARRAGSRLLFILDALNEGAGLRLWPPHLVAFLQRLARSPWIITVVSVRSSYATELLPESAASSAVWLEHDGFGDQVFDAMQAFFEHHGIDLPSTPLLAPEFNNPLYLKTLCKGLQAKGQRQLPRGFHGVVQVFQLYLGGVNEQAARTLDFDWRTDLVSRSLGALAHAMVAQGNSWLPYADAQAIVDAHLPGRPHSRALLTYLLHEGLLLEERTWSPQDSAFASVVQIGYERMADYLCAEALVQSHLTQIDPGAAFQPGAPLDPHAAHSAWLRAGIHEALHILVAERTGQELADLCPALAEHPYAISAFLHSLVWRRPQAVSARAQQLLQALPRSHSSAVVDTLVTLSTVPSHPLNAGFTDRWLRETAMADRDAWWSIGLHRVWNQRSAVDRLVQWADRLWPHSALGDDAQQLAATILAWCLTTSNRPLRDRATKALVRLLTWHPALAGHLIEQFAQIDDAYVAERVLAAAYGAAMRSHDAVGMRSLAATTFAAVFAGKRPRPHVLLREYARGIVQRAQSLEGTVDPAWKDADPPYASDWPDIPTPGEPDAIAPPWSPAATGAWPWSRQRIRSSVMEGDFGRYVIGTNSWTTQWLSLRLDEAPWQSLDRRVEQALATLTAPQRIAWDRWDTARHQDGTLPWRMRPAGTREEMVQPARSMASRSAPQPVDEARALLLATLAGEQRTVLAALMDAHAHHGPRMPKFDLKLVQRYVLARAFSLGWTPERFDAFDSHLASHGREAGKPERIGKKYQWIAYHEMLAFMADHYQYAARPGQDIGAAYQGSWQESLRDIDPSHVNRPPPDRDEGAAAAAAFWDPPGVTAWHPDVEDRAWAAIRDDLPPIETLLFSRDAPSGSEWVNLHAEMRWAMPRPAHADGANDPRREIWLHLDGALVRRSDLSQLGSARVAERLRHGAQSSGSLHELYLGEISGSQASRFFHDPYYAHLGWAAEVQGLGIEAITTSQGYLRERGAFDCSFETPAVRFRVPTDTMLSLLQARWSGISATYQQTSDATQPFDTDVPVVAFDPSVHVQGPSAFLVRRTALLDVLRMHDLSVCWLVHGEKLDAAGAPDHDIHARTSFHGLFLWDGTAVSGRFVFGKIEASDADARD